MKPVTFILLTVLALTVLTPMTLFTLTIVKGEGSFLGDLNVCRSSAPSLSSNSEMPCLGLASCSTAPTLSISFVEREHPVTFELILTSRDERPPRS